MSEQKNEQDAAPSIAQSIRSGGLLLALFAIAGALVLGLTQWATKDRIADNEQALLIAAVTAVIPGNYDNDPVMDSVQVNAPALGAKPITIYRARRFGDPVAAVIEAIAPDGYSGRIKLLVGVLPDGQVSGVRVVSHKETPGLGDGIEIRRSSWITQYDGRSLSNPEPEGWGVGKDGGFVDSLTGATITSRAVTEAVKQALIYFSGNRSTVFASRVDNPSQTSDTSVTGQTP